MDDDRPPGPRPVAPSPRDRTRRRVTAMTWVVLGLVPVLWVVELTGPEWLNLALRALWVVLALGTVSTGMWVLFVRGRRPGGPPPRR